MARFSIIVKGTPSMKPPLPMLGNRGLVYIPGSYHEMETDWSCLVDGDISVLMDWFAEDLGREAPFPQGSLLHFSITKIEHHTGVASDRWEDDQIASRKAGA